jgi:hypothetical protein
MSTSSGCSPRTPRGPRAYAPMCIHAYRTRSARQCQVIATPAAHARLSHLRPMYRAPTCRGRVGAIPSSSASAFVGLGLAVARRPKRSESDAYSYACLRPKCRSGWRRSAVQHDPARFACTAKATRRRAGPFGFAFAGFAAFSRRAAEIFVHEDLTARRAHENLFGLTDRS